MVMVIYFELSWPIMCGRALICALSGHGGDRTPFEDLCFNQPIKESKRDKNAYLVLKFKSKNVPHSQLDKSVSSGIQFIFFLPIDSGQ